MESASCDEHARDDDRTLASRRRTVERTAALVMLAVSTVLLGSVLMQRQRLSEARSSVQEGEAIEDVVGRADIADATQKGSASAPLVMIEFADFQCPFCARNARDVHPTIEREWIEPGNVRYVFMHLPLEAIHHDALDAARAAECAGTQGQFWAMHRRLFASPNDLSAGARRRHAEALGLDLKRFSDCPTAEVDEKIKRQVSLAGRLKIGATPSFLFGGAQADGSVSLTRRVNGAASYEALASVLRRLSSGNSGSRSGL